jgi:hypothetical protein
MYHIAHFKREIGAAASTKAYISVSTVETQVLFHGWDIRYIIAIAGYVIISAFHSDPPMQEGVQNYDC